MEEELRPSIYHFHYDVPEVLSDVELEVDPVEFEKCHCEEILPICIKPVILPEEHTLAIIKPSAQPHAPEIVRRIIDEGYTVLVKKRFHLFPEQATDFFKENYGKTWFPKVMLKISSGPITVMVLTKENAINDFKALIGPRKVCLARKVAPLSLRALYGLKGDEATNGLHASNSVEDARREILFFFPNVVPEPYLTVDEYMTIVYDKYYAFLLEGLSELCKVKPYNPSVWFMNWLTSQNPLKPIVAMPPYPSAELIEKQRYETYKKMHVDSKNM